MFFIYMKPNCPYCQYTEDLLNLYNLPFNKINIAEDDKAYDFVKNVMGRKTVPFIVDSKAQSIGGYEDLVAYLKEHYKAPVVTDENIF